MASHRQSRGKFVDVDASQKTRRPFSSPIYFSMKLGDCEVGVGKCSSGILLISLNPRQQNSLRHDSR